MDKFDKLLLLLRDDIIKVSEEADIIELEFERQWPGCDLAILSGDGYVLKILRDGTWELKD